MKRLETLKSAFTSVVFASALIAPQFAQAAPLTQTIVDMRGATVEVPLRIERLAEQFPAHTVSDIMLGMGNKLVAIPPNVKTIPLLRKIFPDIKNVPETVRSGSTINIEDLAARRPDMVSALGGAIADKQLQAVNIPAVVMTFSTLEQLPVSITLAGKIYGEDAVAKAATFVTYFNAKRAEIQARLASLPESDRPSVVHISSFPPLVVDGGPSIMGDWIRLAGGRDAAKDLFGVHIIVTMEQLIRWNPDVLIVETPGGDQGLTAGSGQAVLRQLSHVAGWSELAAVKANRVFINPQGMYPWDRYGPEEALQIQWAAKTLHPELFKDLDLRTEAKAFYQSFFHYGLTDEDLNQMLQAQK